MIPEDETKWCAGAYNILLLIAYYMEAEYVPT